MFVEQYDLSKLKPAAYNPRKIDADSFERLKASLKALGLIKPVIAASNGTLVAGHQRTKAAQTLGFASVPAFVLGDISITDEIRFNQFHNETDLDLSEEPLCVPASSRTGFVDVAPAALSGVLAVKHAPRKQEIAHLLAKHGQWGSIIATQSGEVLTSKLYAIASKLLGIPVKAYIVPDEKRDLVYQFFGKSYGEFSYDHLPKTTWAQALAQRPRLRNEATDFHGGHSRLYEHCVLPRITKGMRILDFGAGQMDYVKHLSKQGYNIRGIEFYFKKGNHIWVSQVQRDISALCQELEEQCRFDVVVCDSVLNSVDSLQAEEDVLTVLSALCKPHGLIFFSGRARDRIDKANTQKAVTDRRRYIEFIDSNGLSAMFSMGVWRYQKFHYVEEIRALCRRFYGTTFEITNATGEAIRGDVIRETSWNAYARKEQELPAEQCEASLVREFNLPLPEGRSYGRQEDILKAWRSAIAKENQ